MTIQSVYAERFAADLEKNRGEQDGIVQQLEALQVRLEQLKTEEKWLAEMQSAVPAQGVGEPSETAGVAVSVREGVAAEPDVVEEAAVPQPRQSGPGRTAAAKPGAKRTNAKRKGAQKAGTERTGAEKSGAARGVARKTTVKAKTTAAKTPKAAAPSAPAREPAAKKTTASAGSAKKVSQPSLQELVEVVLGRQVGEPRTVREIRAELEALHPERSTSDQVIRNTLERMAKKDLIERSNQQGSVMYTKPQASSDQAPASAVAPAAADERAGLVEANA
ncbi:hypothetical protein J7E93_36285 [Streptomyces sp. ISL-36]|uniref:hypothetical protein n=1 Tax=Streptomyces sp. ISL-36 TaxID=2819182 RepID=UPI001BE7FF79|nr:hypothetical protein [Streptomyces sp. ISL-36]MBT2445445.1 hypothetical protein [Streptomyces sp. ISL-36]